MEAMQNSGFVLYETCTTTFYVLHVFLASIMVYFNTDVAHASIYVLYALP